MSGPDFTSSPRTAIQTEVGQVESLGLKERRCRLVVVSGPDQGNIATFEGARLVVGKSPTCDLVLQDATVSREHFVIEQDGGAFVIRDSGSTNGTWIDQFRIREAWLRPGTELRAGEVRLRFESVYRDVEVEPMQGDQFGSLVGRSVQMRQLFALLERVSKTSATVVMVGETGTGKSAVARAIHDASDRRRGPFVTLDCGSIASTLIESELFGHEKGAFTGATSMRRGALENAQGGTLFIDEMTDLRADLQPRLLRVLEERELRRVGSNTPIQLDVRIIAASRHDLWTEVQNGRFREDLYFRLAVFQMVLPALRDRPEDIEILARRFAEALPGGDAVLNTMTPDVMARLKSHPFFGNVRELRNVIERAALLGADPASMLGPDVGPPRVVQSERTAPGTPFVMPSTQEVAHPSSVPSAVPLPDPASEALQRPPTKTAGLEVDWTLPFKEAKDALLNQFEGEYLRRLLEREAGATASALARTAGIDRKHLYTLAKRHSVELNKKERG